MSNKRDIYITCSELSTITWDNPYSKIHETFETKLQKLLKLLKRNHLAEDPRFSHYTKKRMETKYKKTIGSVRDYVQKYGLSPQEAEEKGYAELSLLSEEQNELHLAKELVQRTAYVTHGRKEESGGLQKFCSTYTCLKAKRDPHFYQSIVHENDYYRVILCGRVDASYKLPNGDSGIVEVKNRVKELFHRIPDYEQIQMYGYFIVTESTEGYLVEVLNSEFNIFELKKNKKEYMRIGEHVKKFSRFLYSFSQLETNHINEYLKLSFSERDEFLKSELNP